jgi:hypothetical protein
MLNTKPDTTSYMHYLIILRLAALLYTDSFKGYLFNWLAIIHD